MKTFVMRLQRTKQMEAVAVRMSIVLLAIARPVHSVEFVRTIAKHTVTVLKAFFVKRTFQTLDPAMCVHT